MDDTTVDRLGIGVGLVGAVAGLLLLLTVAAADQYRQAGLAATGVGVLLVLVGAKTALEFVRE